jgi:hypothetical protein
MVEEREEFDAIHVPGYKKFIVDNRLMTLSEYDEFQRLLQYDKIDIIKMVLDLRAAVDSLVEEVEKLDKDLSSKGKPK